MTQGWKAVKLGDVCDLDKQSYGGSTLPYVGMEDIDSGGTGRFFGSREVQTVKSNTFQFGPQHLLYGRLRPYLNKVLLPDFEGHCSTEIFPVLCNEELDKSFLFYWLTSETVVEKINKTCTGARMPRANFKDVLKFNFRLPPLEEQKRIVAILDEAFEGIEKAQANAEQNLANARELFESELNAAFETKKWKKHRLIDVCKKITQGPNPKYKGQVNPRLRVLKTKDVYDNVIHYNTADCISDEAFESCSKAELINGDVLLAIVGQGSINKCNVFNNPTDHRFIFTRALGLLRAQKEVLDPYFLKNFLQSKAGKGFVDGGIGGTSGQQVVTTTHLKKIQIPLPPMEEQKQIVAKLDKAALLTNRLNFIYEQKLKDLAELKQSLLQKAFSGELTSSNVVAFTRPVSEQQDVATSSPEFAANVLAYAHNWHASQQRDRTFGRVKAQKVLHMAESVAGVDMGRQPIKDAAGPNDFQHMLRAEDWAKNNLFFEFTPRLTGNGYDFKKLGDYNKLIGGALEAVKPYKDKLEKILALMMPMNTREAEVLATVHAAWNNLLLDNAEITDDTIIHEARENWTESKKSIPEHEFRAAITTIRNNGIVPDGTAKRVIGQESLPL